jgi:hypothetical protein
MSIYGFGKNKLKVKSVEAETITGAVTGDVTTPVLNLTATPIGTAPSATSTYVPIEISGVTYYITVLASA